MKVSELIEELKSFDPEMEVVVDGYETGYDVVRSISKVEVFKPKADIIDHKAWYDGDYVHRSKFINADDGEYIEVVYIPRNS